MKSPTKVVLACIDASQVSKAVGDYSCWFANKLNIPLKLLHTIEHSNHPAVADYTGAIGLGSQQELLKELTDAEQNRSRLLIKQGQQMLNQVKQHLNSRCEKGVETGQQHGGLVESLIALEENIDFVVMGIRGEQHEKHHAGIGHQLEAVIRSVKKPVCVVNTAFKQPEEIMLAIDGSDSCHKALEVLAQSPIFRGLSCHVVHVGENGSELLATATEVLATADLQLKTVQLSGNIEQALAAYQLQNNIDLTVMGAFSHSRIREFLLGSFTAKMLSATQRPLLLLH